MRLGIFAKTFAGVGARQVLSAARDAGYDCVQFNMACVGLASLPDDIAPAVITGITVAARETGVGIAALSATYNMIHPDPAIRADGMRRLAVMLPAASTLGAPLVTLCTGTRDAADQWKHHHDNAGPEAWRDLMVEMEKAATLAESHGVDLGIEPELANVVSSARAAAQLLKDVPSPRLRIVLDPANLFEAGPSRRVIADAIGILGPRIAMAHAKDRNATGEFVAAGQGVIDFADFIARLRDASFDGPLVTHGLSAAEAPSVAAFLKHALETA